MEKLRVFVITQEEPFYLPKMIRHLIDCQNDTYEVVGATRLKPHRKNKSMKHWLQERTRIYTWWELSLAGALFVWTKLIRRWWSKLSGSTPYSVRNAYQRAGIVEIDTVDLNAPDYVAQVKALQPHIILSISPPQLFKEELLAAASRYCLNAHGTLLPRHRGVFGSWWTIYEQDQEAGGTIHTMELKLDAGEILWQEAFPVEKDDTQYSIARKTKGAMSAALPKLMRAIAHGEEQAKPVQYSSSYHRAPTRELGKAFHQAGHRVITLRDVRYVLAANFPKTQ